MEHIESGEHEMWRPLNLDDKGPGNLIVPSLFIGIKSNPEETEKKSIKRDGISYPPQKCPPVTDKLSFGAHHF